MRRTRSIGPSTIAVLALLAILAVSTLAVVGPARPALAEPGPSAATTQDGFDTCRTPSSSDMAAWASDSVYSTVGIYIGGVNRSCSHEHLTRSWVSTQLAAGWSIAPLYMDRQAPCTSQSWAKISPTSARSQGVAAGRDAAAAMAALGMGRGSPVYVDIEGYAPKPGCHDAVFRYVDGWVTALHEAGYLAGVYGSALSPIDALADHYPPGADPRPDDLWIARWNGVRDDAEELLDPAAWADRRLHQYRGGHDETHGGVTLRVDSSFVNGSVVRRLTVDRAATHGHAPMASWEGFVAQQQADLQGRTWTLAERQAAVRALAAGSAEPDAYIALLLRSGWYEPHVAPVARLYWAYFGRTPDLGGVRYWAQRHRDGRRLGAVSQQFATSTEFATKTGRLTDEQFVRHIYTDVLGRPADPDGLWFWTARLSSGRATRGDVMVQFSESTEYRRLTGDRVDALLVSAAMLDRRPTADEQAATLTLRQRIAQIRTSPAYATRVR